MELFYTEHYSAGQKQITLSIEESRHIQKVFRKKPQDIIQLTDGKGTLVLAGIAGEQNRQLQLIIKEVRPIPFPNENDIELGISIVRPNRMDWAIEKATELGIKKIVPLHCQYSTFRNLKLDHLKRIAISAIKQSGQVFLPEISSPLPLFDWIEKIGKEQSNRLIAVPDTKGIWAVQSSFADINKYQLLIGPEGGFHANEITMVEQHHFQPLHLGPTILRTETAAIAGITFLKSRTNPANIR